MNRTITKAGGTVAVNELDVQEPAVHVADPDAAPIDQLMLARSPLAVPQLPPIEVMLVFVRYGKVTVAPLTFVTAPAAPQAGTAKGKSLANCCLKALTLGFG